MHQRLNKLFTAVVTLVTAKIRNPTKLLSTNTFRQNRYCLVKTNIYQGPRTLKLVLTYFVLIRTSCV